VTFPQSEAYGPTECQEAFGKIIQAMVAVDQLGAELDKAIVTYPDRFRPPAPVVNLLGTSGNKL
jgi:hypothetical protein